MHIVCSRRRLIELVLLLARWPWRRPSHPRAIQTVRDRVICRAPDRRKNTRELPVKKAAPAEWLSISLRRMCRASMDGNRDGTGERQQTPTTARPSAARRRRTRHRRHRRPEVSWRAADGGQRGAGPESRPPRR